VNNVVSLPNKRDWKWHRDRIAAAWSKQVESIIETGQALIDAKEELEHGSFEAMIQSELPFGRRAAQMLMKIIRNPILSNAKHASHLPPSWMTLHELAKLPDEILMAKLKDGSIHPKLERKDVRAMRPDVKDRPQRATREELIAAIQADPLANQRDAAAALGVSVGTYQRTRNELIGSGQIKNSSPRQAYLDFIHSLPKEEQVQEVSTFFKRELKWTTKEISQFLNITRFKL
jgi:transposase